MAELPERRRGAVREEAHVAVALIWVVVMALMVASNWALFTKAGEPGWKSLIPVYGAVVFLRIVGRPWYWLVLLCIPIVNIIPAFVLCWDTAKAFGKGGGYAAGIALLGPVFLPLLAFSDADYVGPHQPSSPKMARAA